MIPKHAYLDQSISLLAALNDRQINAVRKDLGVSSLGDLLDVFPFRYVDKTQFTNISDLQESNDLIQIKATLSSIREVKGKAKRRLVAQIFDGSGQMELLWFQGISWIPNALEAGKTYIFFGKVSKYGSKFSMVHPEFEPFEEGKKIPVGLEPVYHSTEKLNKAGFTQKKRKKCIKQILSKVPPTVIPDPISESYRKSLKLISLGDAVHKIHFPKSIAERDEAIKRIKFHELFFLQLRILFLKSRRKEQLKGVVFEKVGDAFMKYYNEKIPFELTNAQKRVIKEVRRDVASGFQMNRLIQGDVGSGKTMVALLCMLLAKDNGFQSCLMAPTEILAQQHFESLSETLKGTGVYVGYLSGSIKGKLRKETLRLVSEGLIHILIGTHALLEDWVQFQNIGLAIIDEQHRFGVAQRAKLWAKAKAHIPHILVMTATPIPRTMALTLYGDLDVSVIDELPPGRKKVQTVHKFDNGRPEVYAFIEREIEKGRQIYVVYPLIEESATLDLANLEQGYERLLQRFPRPAYQISVVHGRMKATDKDLEMQRFVNKESHILVATTVIEVGVNVPNASVMLIENAERFGLSQLHQLRGRVGRGNSQSYCILLSSYKLTQQSRERLTTMVRTNDGFEIAEADLQLRGPGDMEGTQQSGVVNLRLSSLTHDKSLLEYCRNFALTILQDDPTLAKAHNQSLLEYMRAGSGNLKEWGRIS